MSIVGLIVLLVVVGLVMWLVNAYLPMQEPYKRILNVLVMVVVVVYVVIWLLRLGGLA